MSEASRGLLQEVADQLLYVTQSETGFGSVTINVRNHRVVEDLDVHVRRRKRK